MPRKSYGAEDRALAYRIWYESNRNVVAALRRLETEYGWPLSRGSMLKWSAEEAWGARADGQDAEDRRRARAERVDRLTMLAGLDLQIQRYESVFAGLGPDDMPDPRSVSAYTGLVRLRLDLVRDVDAGAGLDRGDIAAQAVEWLANWTATHRADLAPMLSELLTVAAVPLADAFSGRT